VGNGRVEEHISEKDSKAGLRFKVCFVFVYWLAHAPWWRFLKCFLPFDLPTQSPLPVLIFSQLLASPPP